MKLLPVVLLVVALSVQRASSLYCYKCENAKYHKDCKEVKCSDMEIHCVTATSEFSEIKPKQTNGIGCFAWPGNHRIDWTASQCGQNISVSKWCSPTCPKPGEIKGGKRTVDCCQTDYCNRGAGGARGNYALLGAALLASCFYALRTGL